MANQGYAPRPQVRRRANPTQLQGMAQSEPAQTFVNTPGYKGKVDTSAFDKLVSWGRTVAKGTLSFLERASGMNYDGTRRKK